MECVYYGVHQTHPQALKTVPDPVLEEMTVPFFMYRTIASNDSRQRAPYMQRVKYMQSHHPPLQGFVQKVLFVIES